MKLIFVLASLTAVALAAPANDGGVKLTHFGHDVGPDGYAFAFATSDGTYRHEIGGLKSVGDSDSLSVQGAYSFVGGDGNQYAVSYTADENGFQVQNPFKPISCPLSLAIAVSAAPQGPPQQDAVQILNQQSNVSPNGYNFEFNTSDGTSRQEQGQLENVGTDDEGIAIKGQYTYVSPDGQKYAVTYTADNNGFQPQIHLESGNSVQN